jgi:hypothetical protein
MRVQIIQKLESFGIMEQKDRMERFGIERKEERDLILKCFLMRE